MALEVQLGSARTAVGAAVAQLEEKASPHTTPIDSETQPRITVQAWIMSYCESKASGCCKHSVLILGAICHLSVYFDVQAYPVLSFPLMAHPCQAAIEW